VKVERRVMEMLDNGNLTNSLELKNLQKYRHWHEEVEFVYVKKGKLLLEIDHLRIVIEAGMLFVIAEEVPHIYLEIEGESELHIAKMNISKGWRGISNKTGGEVGESAFVTKVDKELKSNYEDMMFADYHALTDLYVVGKAFEIFAYIYSGKLKHVTKVKTNIIEPSNLVFRIREYFLKNMKEDVSLTSLAEYLGISVGYCSKIMKEKTALSFLEYLNFVRLDVAENMLANTDMKVIEICYEAGFHSIQSFNRNFKKYKGITPNAYRARYQNTKI
jgi:AraC-type DNA-binding domain-containing proteins